MFRKNYFIFLLATALFLASGITAFAQNAPITGRVELTKADGTKAPVAGALVEIFRMDQRVKLPSGKTDKKGNFAFAGVQLGGKYVLAVSGAGIAPTVYPNVSPGAENIVIPVTEGDGKRWTEEEVKQAVTSRTNTTTNTTTTTTTNSEEAKKQEEAIRKQNEENERIKNANTTINTSLKEGNLAFEQKNYDLAITKFQEGYNAAPTFAPSATVFLNNIAASYLERIRVAIKTITKENRASVLESIKNDSQKVVENSEKALELLKTATPANETQRTRYEQIKFDALRNRKSAYFLSIRNGADTTKGKEAIIAFQEYLAVEKNLETKIKTQLEFADVLFDIQEIDQALAEYEKILADNPNNLDALAGAGFTLVTIAYTNNEDKAKFQLAANYLQKFYDLAPATHPRKEDAKMVLDTLKKDYKITPKK